MVRLTSIHRWISIFLSIARTHTFHTHAQTHIQAHLHVFHSTVLYCTRIHITSHHQPINVPTAGAQAFLMDYPQGERAITHHAGPVRIGGSR
jgi:hypothetical protein